jgi:hypothetical protein
MSDNPARLAEGGFEFGYDAPVHPAVSRPPQFFVETASADTKEAWQTFYPPLGAALPGNRFVPKPTWRETPEGYVEDYIPAQLGNGQKPGRKDASWFDSRILNYDGFGRPKLPDKGNPQRLWDTGTTDTAWVEQSVNTSLECVDIACTANATLYAFDPETEEATNCKLSIGVHATDFDNDFGDEFIHSLLVNGHVVNTLCEPMVGGCSPDAQIPLYTCVNGVDVDHLLAPESGAFTVQATLSQLVDECPKDGNLLSGVAMATCMVRPKVEPDEVLLSGELEEPAENLTTTFVSAPIQCNTPGCVATADIEVPADVAYAGGACLMNITLESTDFDDALGEPEEVEWVKLPSLGTIVNGTTSGINPCTSAKQGNPLEPEEILWQVVSEYDVTQQVLTGLLSVNLKISPHVDECPSEYGNLVEGLVTIRCYPPANATTADIVEPCATR